MNDRTLGIARPTFGGRNAGGGGGNAALAVPLFWHEEQSMRAKTLLNTAASEQINWENRWAPTTNTVTLQPTGTLAPPIEDVDLPGFFRFTGGGGFSQTICWGRDNQLIFDRLRTSAFYASVYCYLRAPLSAGPTFTSLLDLSNAAGTYAAMIASSGVAGGSFDLYTFVGGVLMDQISCGSIGTPGNPTCPIGAGFTVAMYNSPREGITGVEFNAVTAIRQFVPNMPNERAVFYAFGNDTVALMSIGASYCAGVRV